LEKEPENFEIIEEKSVSMEIYIPPLNIELEMDGEHWSFR